jgi:hypothetical protein
MQKNLSDLLITLKYLILLLSTTVIQQFLEDYFSINSTITSKLSKEFYEKPVELAFIAIVFAPFIEEVIFRLPLRKTKLFVFSLLFSLIFIKGFKSLDLIVSVSVIIYCVVILYYQFFAENRIIHCIMISFSVFTFTVVHISNYEYTELITKEYFELILLFLPQLLLGFFSTNLRIKTKFVYSLILHTIYNATILCFIYFT